MTCALHMHTIEVGNNGIYEFVEGGRDGIKYEEVGAVHICQEWIGLKEGT